MEKFSILVALDVKLISGLLQVMLILIKHVLKLSLWKLKPDLHSVLILAMVMCHAIQTTLRFIFFLEIIY